MDSQFLCMNRVDQIGTIFKRKVEQERPKARKLSLLLTHTEDYFKCGNDHLYWSDFSFDWIDSFNIYNCELLDGTKIRLHRLITEMVMDQSLQMKEYPAVERTLKEYLHSTSGYYLR